MQILFMQRSPGTRVPNKSRETCSCTCSLNINQCRMRGCLQTRHPHLGFDVISDLELPSRDIWVAMKDSRRTSLGSQILAHEVVDPWISISVE